MSGSGLGNKPSVRHRTGLSSGPVPAPVHWLRGPRELRRVCTQVDEPIPFTDPEPTRKLRSRCMECSCVGQIDVQTALVIGVRFVRHVEGAISKASNCQNSPPVGFTCLLGIIHRPDPEIDVHRNDTSEVVDSHRSDFAVVKAVRKLFSELKDCHCPKRIRRVNPSVIENGQSHLS